MQFQGATVDGCEIRRRGRSFTVDTLREIGAANPGVRWRLVIGSDLLTDFPRWRDPEGILALVDAVLVVARGGWDGTVPPLLAGAARVVRGFRHPASATRIRRELAAGRRDLPDLPAPVAAYVAEHGLYRRDDAADGHRREES